MATNNSSNQQYSNEADGFKLAGGSTKRQLTLTGGDVTLTESGSNAYTMPGGNTTLVGTTTAQTLTNKTLTAPVLTTPNLGTPSALTLTNATGLVATTGLTATGTKSSSTYLRGDDTWATISAGDASTNTATSVDGEVVLFNGTSGKSLKRATATGIAKLTSGVLGTATAGTDYVTPTGTETLTNKTLTSPVLTAPVLGTPASGTLTNATGLPVATGISGLGTGVATFLATPSSANLATAVTDETGSGALVFGTSPTLTTPVIASIVNTGTLTLPTVTDTLVARTTTDTLTNKTLTSPSISSPTFSGSYSFGGTPSWPTFNQSTSGSAATLTTGRTIQTDLTSTSSATFNGSTNITPGVTGTLPAENGGTGNAFTAFTGPTTSTKTFTLPNATATILTTNAAVTVAQGGTGVSTLTGIVKGNGTSAFSAATAGTDYTSPSSTETMTNKTLTSPALTSPTVTDYVESVVAIGTVTTTSTISLASGTIQTATLTASTACTFTMPTATAGKSFVMYLKQAASTGNGSATFTGVKWPTAGAPTITVTAGKMDILTFVADGASWYGSYVQGFTP